MKAGDVYVAIADNGHEPGTPLYEARIVGCYTDEIPAMLALFDNGFGERDESGCYWRKTECAWIERHELHDSYVSRRDR